MVKVRTKILLCLCLLFPFVPLPFFLIVSGFPLLAVDPRILTADMFCGYFGETHRPADKASKDTGASELAGGVLVGCLVSMAAEKLNFCPLIVNLYHRWVLHGITVHLPWKQS